MKHAKYDGTNWHRALVDRMEAERREFLRDKSWWYRHNPFDADDLPALCVIVGLVVFFVAVVFGGGRP